MIDFALADDRLLDAADRGGAGDGGNLHLHLEADFVIGMHTRRNVHVDAHVDVRELCVDEGVHEARAACRADAHSRLEATSGDRYTIADVEFCRLPVHRSNFWVLNDFSEGIGQDGIRRCTWQRHAVVLRAEMLQIVQRERSGGRCASRSSCCAARRERHGGLLPRKHTKIPQAIGARLQDFHLNNHFRLGFVNIANHLAREEQFVRRIAHNDGVLRVELLNALQVQQLPQTSHNFGQVLRLDGVGKIKSLDNLFFVVAALLRLIGEHENNVFRHRLPYRFTLHRNDVHRLFQRHVGELHRDAPCGEVRVVNYRQSRQFSDRVKNNLRIIRHFHRDGGTRERLDFRRQYCQRRLICVCRRLRRCIGLAAFLCDQLDRFPQFLFCHRAGRIDGLCPLELAGRALQIALFPQFHALLDVRLTRLEARLVQLNFVVGVVRVGFEGFLVVAECSIVVLKGFRLPALVKIRVSFRAARGEQSETDT